MFKNYFDVLVVFCFIRSKSISTYNIVWTTIQNVDVKRLIENFNIKEFHLDFEISTHNAIIHFYPDCKRIIRSGL